MREIKFRSKRLDNGEWVYGDLIHTNQGTLIISRLSANGYKIKIDEAYDVESNTVSQFTGLQDKNGKDIYEGDILFNPFFGDYWQVIFKDGAFIAQLLPIEKDCIEDLSVINASFDKAGNVFDNPELKEG